MSLERPIVVYAGDVVRGTSLRAAMEALGWYLLTPTEMLETLATYVFYEPDLYILEDAPLSTLAEEVYFHLRSVEAAPILVLTDERRVTEWNLPASRGRVVPRPGDLAHLIGLARELMGVSPLAEPAGIAESEWLAR